jgi:fucose 4-O-acetylase-like acetyltransferase
MKDNISRISWLDNGKAVCMLITILFHTELIYLGKTNLFTNLVFLNTSMVFFFFVSGYLINIQTLH